MSRRRSGAAASLLLATALVAACGDDAGDTASGTGGGSSAGGTGGETSGGGGGEAEAVGEALVALLNVEDEIFQVEIEGSPFASLSMNRGSGIVFVAPIFDCGAGTCLEVFREGFPEPMELAVDDGGTVVHFFAGAAGEEGDVTTDEAIPDPGLGETAVVVRSFLEGPALTLSAPTGTLSPLDAGVATVASGQQVVLVLPDQTILETDIVLEEAVSYAITADHSATGGFDVVVCPLEDGDDCESVAFGG